MIVVTLYGELVSNFNSYLGGHTSDGFAVSVFDVNSAYNFYIEPLLNEKYATFNERFDRAEQLFQSCQPGVNSLCKIYNVKRISDPLSPSFNEFIIKEGFDKNQHVPWTTDRTICTCVNGIPIVRNLGGVESIFRIKFENVLGSFTE